MEAARRRDPQRTFQAEAPQQSVTVVGPPVTSPCTVFVYGSTIVTPPTVIVLTPSMKPEPNR